ncbi:hypothetical protein ACFU7Y_17590 [Kitasatospora sp. NPDC057542]|uniref:hypothetical protein n=1 Tax=Kitasatospora sp. NPDC057542 TaxID=3346162 RepID=UPI00369462B9
MIAVFCAVGVLVGVLMARGWGTAWQRKALLAYGWLSACVLTFLVPDYSLLGLLVFSPLLLVFAVTGVPGHQTMGDILYWHRGNLVIVFVGGLLWAAMTLAYQRRTSGQCVRCGRGAGAAAPWTEAATALRWGRWAVWTAVISTLPYDAVAGAGTADRGSTCPRHDRWQPQHPLSRETISSRLPTRPAHRHS